MSKVEYESEVKYVAHIHGNPIKSDDIEWFVSGYPCNNDDQSKSACNHTYTPGDKDEDFHLDLKVNQSTIKFNSLMLLDVVGCR